MTRSSPLSLAALSALLAACAPVQAAPTAGKPASASASASVSVSGGPVAQAPEEGWRDWAGGPISEAARSTAVLGSDGRPLGPSAYAGPREALVAGDMAAFVASARRVDADSEFDNEIVALVLAMDRIAARDYAAAAEHLPDATGDEAGGARQIARFVAAWLPALEGDVEASVTELRKTGQALPGLTAELSLAALLQAGGREDEALAIYSALTPSKIKAPEHDFDPQGILFTHVQTVISRRALLLRQLGRVEEAKDVYRRLADAEPEQAVFYASALERLESGRGLADEPLDMHAALARSFSDLSLALYQQRVIRNAMVGRRLRGLDTQRAVMDQLALLVDPENDGLRQVVYESLYDEAYYAGAAHVAQSAPKPTADLQIEAARAHLMAEDEPAARAAARRAVEVADEEERFGVLSGAIGLLALLGEEAQALSYADEAEALAVDDAERASIAAQRAGVYSQFGAHDKAVDAARRARRLDDTHSRRMTLASLLGEAGEVEAGLQLIRNERLKRPNDPYMLNTLGYYLIEHTDKFEEGFRVLYRANALAPNDPYIADSLGWAYYRLGRLEEARRLIALARRELDPKVHWEIEDHMGDILWHLNEREAAREAWQAALQEFPPRKVRQQIEEKLENGLNEGPPEERPVPSVSLDEDTVEQRET